MGFTLEEPRLCGALLNTSCLGTADPRLWFRTCRGRFCL